MEKYSPKLLSFTEKEVRIAMSDRDLIDMATEVLKDMDQHGCINFMEYLPKKGIELDFDEYHELEARVMTKNLIFVNKNLKGEALNYLLAHEYAHVVFDVMRSEDIEPYCEAFACLTTGHLEPPDGLAKWKE